jgi:hypothetical protein
MEVEDILPDRRLFANVIQNEDPKQIALIVKETPLWLFSSLLENYLCPPSRMRLLDFHEENCEYKTTWFPFYTFPWQDGRLTFRLELVIPDCLCDEEAHIQTLYEGKWYLLDNRRRFLFFGLPTENDNDDYEGVETVWTNSDDRSFYDGVCTVTVLY